MNFKIISSLLILLLAAQAAQGQGILSFIFKVISFFMSWLFGNLMPVFDDASIIQQLLSLIFTPAIVRSPYRAMMAIRAANSPGATAIANYASAMSSMSASVDITAAAMMISGGSFSESEAALAEAMSINFQLSTKTIVYVVMSMLAVISRTAPSPNPLTELPLPEPPANLTDSSLVVNVTIGMQAQFFLSYVPFLIQELNSSTQACQDYVDSVNANCSCANATMVNETIAQWENITAQFESLISVTICNGTLIASLNTTTLESLVAAMNGTKTILSDNRDGNVCAANAVKSGRYCATRSCHSTASKCKSRQKSSVSRAKSVMKRLRKGRRKKAERARKSLQKRIRKRAKNYFKSMRGCLRRFLRTSRWFIFSFIANQLSEFYANIQMLQGNFTAAFEALANNASTAIEAAQQNVTEYINNATIDTEIAISNFTVEVLTNPDAGNCSVYANVSLALLAYLTNSIDACQVGMDENTTAIFANISAQLTGFGEMYNSFVQQEAKCAALIASSPLGFFKYFWRRRIDKSREQNYIKCHNDTEQNLINATISINVTVEMSVSVIVTSLEEIVSATETCVDAAVERTMLLLDVVRGNYSLCLDPSATTTTTEPETTTTAEPTTTTEPAPTEPTTTEAPTTTTCAPLPYPECKFDLFNLALVLFNAGTSQQSAECTGETCPGRTYQQSFTNKCCCM